MDESISNEDSNSVDDSIIDDDDTTSLPCSTERESVSKINYQVLTADEIVQYVNDYVKDVNSIVQLSTTVTRLLLSQCKWDKRVLVEKFFENPEKLFNDSHVINPFNKSINSVIQTNECEICLLELQSTSSTALDCGHRFCAACWSEYLKVKIMHEGFGMSIQCAASDCDIIIDDDTVFELVNDSEVKLVYQRLITNSFVQQNQLLRWCPAPACSFAMKLEYSPLRLTACKCKCEYEFCFDCGDEWHGPVSCEVLRRFHVQEVKCNFRQRWVQPTRTYGYDDKIKTCPICTVYVQKISGCNVMQCKNCFGYFCWDCLKCYKTKKEIYLHMSWHKNNAEVELTPKTTEIVEQKRDEGHNNDRDYSPPQKYAKKMTGEFSLKRQKTTNVKDNVQNPLQTKEAAVNESKPNTIDVFQRADNLTPEQTDNNLPPIHGEDNRQEHFNVNRHQPEHNGPNMEFNDVLQPNPHLVPFKNIAHPPMALRTYPLRMRHPNVAGGRRLMCPYYFRYVEQTASLRVAKKRCNKIRQFSKSLEIKTPDLVQLEKVSNVLRQCQQTLKYSSIFALYLEKVGQSLIFEGLYDDLEKATKSLCVSMGSVNFNNLNDLEIKNQKTIMRDYRYRYCEKGRQALLNYIDDGFDNDWWKFRNRPAEMDGLQSGMSAAEFQPPFKPPPTYFSPAEPPAVDVVKSRLKPAGKRLGNNEIFSKKFKN